MRHLKELIESTNDLPADATFPNGIVAIDTETMGLNPLRDRLCVAQLSDGEGRVWLVKFDGTDYSAPNLKALLLDPKVCKLFHYARVDVAVLYHYIGAMSSDIYCTKIASKLTRTYTDRHGLKTLVSEITGTALDKEQQSSNWGAPELTEAQKHYAASDVLYLHKLKEYFDEQLKELDRVELAYNSFDYLKTRCMLDLSGWEKTDIFSH